MPFENKPSNNFNKSSDRQKPYIGVGGEDQRNMGNLNDKLEMLFRRNFGIPNLYKSEKEFAKNWLKAIESTKKEVSSTRLYFMAQQSLKGRMAKWFTAFEGDTFENLDELIMFFKKQFLVEEEFEEIKF
ncbi:hypothetical protein DMUE_4581 [Dictyocoela muelleri]|nr:hypothetical protein DMUE_4581 [Dictyocoela muelleri]